MGKRRHLYVSAVGVLLGACTTAGSGAGSEEQAPGADAGAAGEETADGDDDEGGGGGVVPADPGCEVSIQKSNGDTFLVSYDQQGYMLTASTKTGSAQRLNVYEWNGEGTEVTWDHSFGGSLVFAATMDFAGESPATRRPDGLVMVREGSTDRSWVYTYASGRLTRKQEYNDTLFVVDNVYQYDGAGLLTTYQVGYPNILEEHVITRDDGGRITRIDHSLGGDPDGSETYAYDADGWPSNMKGSDGVNAEYAYEGDDCELAVARWRMNWPDVYEP